tara:strand:+ start:977 stop:2011 length:1035 start_codon:yes stop_codon:yes gene_type:complete
MSNQPPIGVPQGAIRLNTDSSKLEFFDGYLWYEMAGHSDVLDGSAGRALIFEGDASSNKIDVIHIDTQGNATDFGVTHYNNDSVGSSGDRTRALVYGGGSPSTTNKMEFHTIATTGISGIDFGDLTFTARQPGNACNSTRSLICGGYPSPYSTGNAVNTICYVTTQSTGNAQDFGDLVTTGEQIMSSSPTRGVGIGGYGVGPSAPSGGRLTECQYITTHTLGNAFDFSELAVERNDANGAGNNVRGVFLGGAHDSGKTDAITFVEFASLGKPTDFGNLISAGQSHCCTSNKTRAVKTNGSIVGGPSTNRIEYVNIATGGDAVEFGDATYTGASSAAHCNAQGGL